MILLALIGLAVVQLVLVIWLLLRRTPKPDHGELVAALNTGNERTERELGERLRRLQRRRRDLLGDPPAADRRRRQTLLISRVLRRQLRLLGLGALAVAVGAMVLAFVALVALANGLLAGIGGWFGYPDLSFQAVIGAIFRPVMWLMGVPWEESAVVGGLFGIALALLVGGVLVLAEVAVQFSLVAVLGVFACALVTGVVFGFMPARKAARLDPVKALSRE